MWIDIWEKMEELNSRITRERYYLDYKELCRDERQRPQKIEWVLKYSRALIHEVAEYYDESDDHKAKIELIDVLFFLVSVLQTAGWTKESFKELMEKEHVPFDIDEDYPENMIFSAIKIEQALPWKHWKSYTTGIIYNKLYKYISDFVDDWKEHTYIEYGMTPETVHQAFLDKLDVNHKRQDDGYHEKKKDDDIHVRTK